MPSDRLSYVHGTSLEPLLDETFGRNFERIAMQIPEREALARIIHEELADIA